MTKPITFQGMPIVTCIKAPNNNTFLVIPINQKICLYCGELLSKHKEDGTIDNVPNQSL